MLANHSGTKNEQHGTAQLHTYTRARILLATVAVLGMLFSYSTFTGQSLVLAQSPFYFVPVADSQVVEVSPDTNYGTQARLRADLPGEESYLRFTISGVTETIETATLRMYSINNGSSDGPKLYGTDNTWTETGITWNNRPAPTTGVIADVGTVLSGTWAEYDVTSWVTGDGTYNFVILADSTDSITFYSREGSYPPELVLTFATEPTPTTGPSPTATNTPTPTDTPTQGPSPTPTNTNVPTFTPAATSTPSTPTILTFLPIDDANIASGSPATNYASDPTLQVDNKPITHFLIKFDVSGVNGRPVTSAVLRLYNIDPSNRGGDFYPVSDNTWQEETVTWNTAPAAGTTLLASLGSVNPDNWYEVNLTSLITQDGTYSLRVSSTATNGADYFSKEGTNPPQLVITVDNSSPPTATDTPTSTPVPPTATNTPVPPTATNTPTNTSVPPTATSTPTNTPVPPTATNTLTNTPVPPTATDTPTSTPVPPTATNTSVPPTATDTPTSTSVPPTATSTPTNTPVPPTATNTPILATTTDTPTSTPVPPTATDTPSSTPAPPTATNTPTSTPVPPTATNTPTNTPIPPTATDTPTNTPVPPTATDTPTNTPVPPTATYTPTNTPVPPTATYTPTNTPVPPTATNTPTNTPIPPTATNTPSGPTILTFIPLDDANIASGSPATNYASDTTLLVDNSPITHFLIKFDVSGVNGLPVTSAVLRLYNVDPSTRGGDFYLVSDNTWQEETVTWNTAPTAGTTLLASLGSVSPNNWYEVNLTSLITHDGTYSLRISSTSSNGADYFSKEGTNPPQLVVTVDNSPPTATVTPGPSPTPTNTPTGSSVVFVGAGDISTCGNNHDEETAQLIDNIPGTVFTIGDNVYESGTSTEFNNCYNPTWGRFKNRTYPAVGNHEYGTAGASGYFNYFGAAAGDPTKGYYSFDLGSWHIIMLNSECAQVGGCDASSPQGQWLQADLAANPRACTLAIMHRPLFSSSSRSLSMEKLWVPLYEVGADIVLSGHMHNYERFAPQNPQGVADPNGIREFVVGTGGKSNYNSNNGAPNSEVYNGKTYGVLKLTLHPTSYDWEFVPVVGDTFTDSGSAPCVIP